MSMDFIANNKVGKYGFPWPEGILDIHRELFCYAIMRGNYGIAWENKTLRPQGLTRADFGFKEPIVHLLAASKLMWPTDVEVQVRQYINRPLLRVWEELCSSDDVGIAGNASAGKCLGRGTPIRMHDGSIKSVEDVAVGDFVMGDDGLSARAVLWAGGGRKPLYRISPHKGRPWVCNKDHILTLKCPRNVYGKKLKSGGRSKSDVFVAGKIVDIPIEEYLAKGVLFKHEMRQFKVPIELPESDVELDPYCYGAWLADGSIDAACLWKPKCKMSDYWCDYFSSLGYSISVWGKNRCPGWNACWNKKDGNRMSPAIEFFRRSVIDGSKRIIKSYLSNSVSIRRRLLAGMLDGDGHASRAGFEYTCAGEGFGDDFEELCNSLGLYATRSIKIVKGTPYQRFYVSGDFSLIPTKDKIAKTENRMADPTCVGFTVEPIGVGDYFGFTVDGNQRFLLGDGTVCHNTHPTAAWLLMDWFAAPHETLSFVASTSLSGSEDRIWGAVAKLWRRSAFPIGHMIDHRKIIVFENPSADDQREYTNAIKALAFPRGDEGQRAIDTTRGRKNSRVRAVIDELAEMDTYVNNIKVNLRSNDDMIYVGIANPSPTENPHKALCEPADPRGYESITVNDRRWKTRTGTAIFLHGEDSPNFEAPEDEPPPFPYLLTRRKRVDMLKACYGDENSVEYMRNCIGFWPSDSLENTVMSKTLIRNANISYEPQWSSAAKIRLATLDCAWTSGGDRNEVSYGFIGSLRESGKSVLMYQGGKGYAIEHGKVFEDSLAEKVVPDLIKMGIAPNHFGLDVSGDGGKVLSAFIKFWIKLDPRATEIIPITASGKPSDKRVSSDDLRSCADVYDRRVTEYWFSVYHAIASRCLFGLDVMEHKELCAELCSRRYDFKGKKMSVEVKKDMKSRIGKSPDKADSLTYLFEISRRFGVEIIGDDKVVSRYVEDVIEMVDEDEIASYSGGSFDEDGF